MHTRSTLIRIVALALLLYSLSFFAASLRSLHRAEDSVRERQLHLEELERENARLKARIESMNSDEGIEAMARERLGLVMPGEKIFYFTYDSADADA